MSGGVDSSATAALLLEQGYEVVGITLKLWPQDCVNRAEDKCCGPQAVTDARSVCHQLGIPYYLIDEAAEFQKHVINYFADEYKAGRTPNPCVMCNQNLKFGRLIDRADQLGADFIATGHFARVEKADGRHLLKRGRDQRKDQSYFLFSLRQDQLARAMFPLGEKTKSDTRKVARHCNLKTADKEESMEICFVPDNNYGGFLQSANLVQKHRGEITDVHGHVLGQHDGIEFYTIGQRKGLGIGGRAHRAGDAWYVAGKDTGSNRLLVVQGHDHPALQRTRLRARAPSWISGRAPFAGSACTAKTRYRQSDARCTIARIDADSFDLEFEQPQWAVTPGQSVVLYDGEVCLGGGMIE